MSLIITPGHPDFNNYVHSKLPPGFGSCQNYVARSDTGLLSPMTDEELTEYLNGGEYDEVMAEDEDFLTDEFY